MKNRRAQMVAWLLALLLVVGMTPDMGAVQAAKKVALNKKKITLQVGASTKLEVKNTKKKVTWKTSNKKIVKVNKTGKVTALKKGNAKITAKVAGKKLICKVKVLPKNTTETGTTEAVAPTPLTTEQSTTEQKTIEKPATTEKPETPPTDDKVIGDGWVYENGILTINKLYYSIYNLVGVRNYVLDISWGEYSDDVTDLILDGEAVLVEDEYEGNQEENGYIGPGLWFNNMPALQNVTIKHFDPDNIDDLSWMFAYNEHLMYVDGSGLDLSSARSISRMFEGDTNLRSVSLNTWDTSNISYMSLLFAGCTNLTSVEVSSWNTSNVKDFSHVFDGCSSITGVDLSGWTIDNADVGAMFAGCKALTRVNLKNVTLNGISAIGMFDENNSIQSYLFADDWKIDEADEGKYYSPLPPFSYNVPMLMPSINGETRIVVYIYYTKIVPDWHKEEMELMYSVSDMTEVYHSTKLCIFDSSGDVDEFYKNEYKKWYDEAKKKISEELKETTKDYIVQYLTTKKDYSEENAKNAADKVIETWCAAKTAGEETNDAMEFCEVIQEGGKDAAEALIEKVDELIVEMQKNSEEN